MNQLIGQSNTFINTLISGVCAQSIESCSEVGGMPSEGNVRNPFFKFSISIDLVIKN